MKGYGLARLFYRRGARALLWRLPPAWRARLGEPWLRLARRCFPQIEARSIEELLLEPPGQAGLPAWTRPELSALAELEPALAPLADGRLQPPPCRIPWGLTYVGRYYARARRRLRGRYRCIVLGGGDCPPTLPAGLPRPTLLVDVAADRRWRRLARAHGVDYLPLPPDWLREEEHAAVLARVLLQCAPEVTLCLPHPLIARCVERHGRALAAVTRLALVPDEDSSVNGPHPAAHPSTHRHP
ncbi:MAG: hypothetical protein QJR11_07310 [Fulvimonas sp.]|nr:hypothetical protein [Fulvimonas sp.]